MEQTLLLILTCTKAQERIVFDRVKGCADQSIETHKIQGEILKYFDKRRNTDTVKFYLCLCSPL